MAAPKTFLVTGGTGSQGGAVARALLAAHHRVHALVRNPTSAASLALAAAGARLFSGDFSDAAALESAAATCVGVFINVSPTAPPELELSHAQNVIRAARAAGVTRCVYSSVVNAGRQAAFRSSTADGTATTPFDAATTFRASYWLAKAAIQDAVAAAGFETWTVLQPGFLLPNLVAPVSRGYFRDLAAKHVLNCAYRPDTRIAVTDPADVGQFAVRAFLEPDSAGVGVERVWDRKVVPVACLERPTMDEVARAMADVSGREVRVDFLSEEDFWERRGREALVASQGWARDGWLDVDVDEVRSYGVEMGTLRGFLEREKEAVRRSFND